MNQKFKENYINLIEEAVQKEFKNSKKFLAFKKSFCGENKIPQPSNADLRELYENLITQNKIKKNPSLEKAMLSRAIRTQSGVAVVAVLTKPSSCPGKCIFCPTEKNMPKSYLSNEPAVMRAIMNKFDAYNQVQSRLRALELNGHSIEKIELIVMGGTFSYFPKYYQKKFILDCFRAANNYRRVYKVGKFIKPKQDELLNKLKKEQKKNETAHCRIVGLTLETRPDYINEKEILNFRQLGCTRVELGVQTIFDEILEKNNREHLIDATIRATRLLKNAGFKINYHMMPGLWGSTIQKDFKMFQELFSNPDFQPDMLKIYPTVVTKNSELYNLWKKGIYQALTDKKFENLIIKIKNEIIPPYVRIQRLIRDVPLPSIEAGPKISNLRQIIQEKSHCQCIRCREIKSDYKSTDKIILNRIDYNASNGKEIFLQYVSPDKNKLYSMLRLRIPRSQTPPPCTQGGGWEGVLYEKLSVLKNSALIRELHTFGKLISLKEKNKVSPQHIGLGKKLLLEAEKIAREEFDLKKITVISGIGVRNYYRQNGYRLRDSYMTKNI